MPEFLVGHEDAAMMVAAWWVASAFIQKLPEPLENERWYRWLHDSLQFLAANTRMTGTAAKKPQ